MNGRGSKTAVEHISPQQLQKLLASENPPLLIDVRDQWEYDIAHLEGAWLLPLGEFDVHVGDVPRDREIVVYCHHGMRSAAAVYMLLQLQYTDVKNLSGGIDRWASEIDPGMPRY